MSLIRRGGEGITLLTGLGSGYLVGKALGYLPGGMGRRWNRAMHRLGGPLLSAYCQRHGALLIKIAQFVASRPDLFPLAYVDACAPLRDQAAPRPFILLRETLVHAYEGRIADHLPRIEEEPIAAASFGQVHRAWLADGSLVAVKIQYPDLGPRVAMDLWLLRQAMFLFNLLLPGWPLKLVHDEIRRTSHEEQDYLSEATAADRLRPLLIKHGIDVPEIRWEHTREKVLVMQFAPGATLARTDLKALPADLRLELAERIIDGYLAQLLDSGFFHGDPHAGNFILDGRRLWLIDFGMTAEIGRHEREQYRRFLERLRQDDTDGMVDVLAEIGFVTPGADRSSLKALAREVYASLAHLDPATFKGSNREAELSGKVGEFLRRMQGGLVFPRHTILLTRALTLAEGICLELNPGVSMLTLVRPRLKRQLSIWKQVRSFAEDLGEFWTSLRSLPQQVNDALRPKGPDPVLNALLAAVLLLAVLQVPEGPLRTWGTVAAGIAVALALLRR